MTDRLAFLARHPELPLVIGIDRSLADDNEFPVILDHYPQLVDRLFRFRDFPGVDRVLKMLEGRVSAHSVTGGGISR